MRICNTLVAVCTVLAGVTFVGGVAHAAEKKRPRSFLTATIHVFINPRRDTGYPWHGPGDLFVLKGKMVTHLPEAPGAVLCIVTMDGRHICPGQASSQPDDERGSAPVPKSVPVPSGSADTHLPSLARGNRPQSPCPSSYDCEFDEIALPKDEMFGIVVIDPAMAFINLVDAVIVTRRHVSKKDPDVVAFDQRLREAIAELAPPGPFEAKRRQRAFQIRDINECEDGCTFTQSKMKIKFD